MRTDSSSESVLVIADPGTTEMIGERLSEALAGWESADGWEVSTRSQAYPIEDHTDFVDVVSTLDPDSVSEDIVIYLTDLPRRSGMIPLVAEIDLSRRLAVISIPGMGAAFIERRTTNLARTVVAEMSSEPSEPGPKGERFQRVQDGDVVRYVAPSKLSRFRLLAGMVHANRPWRVVAGMSKVMMAAFATGAVSLAYGTMWELSDNMGPWRLGVATVLSIAAMIAWLIIEHELWERPTTPGERERAVLYNMSTIVTLTIGVMVFYVAVFVLLLLTAWWTIPPDMFADQIGHPAGFSSLAIMAWLVASVATLGGALGSGMEDDDAVRAATYGARQRQRFERGDSDSRRSG